MKRYKNTMIKYETRITDNKFYVDFNIIPDNVVCSRGNYTAIHKSNNGQGTGERGVWEGVQVYEAYGRVGEGNPWVPIAKDRPTIFTHDNGHHIQIKVVYRLTTMGYHWQCTDGSIPFFYYGNINGIPSRYVHGYFTDSVPSPPSNNLHETHAIVPKDWTYVKSEWSDWAYNNAPSGYKISNGRYAQRNVSATSSNGWISDSGWTQIYRKSCRFTFEKTYTADIVSSGISKSANTPILTVKTAKGSSGDITIKHTDNSGYKGKFRIYAYCKNKTAIINDFNQSGWHNNGAQLTYHVDFDKVFGEDYSGNNVTYEAWVQNECGNISKSTGIKGGHRYNGRPSIPTGLRVTAINDLIYNKVSFNWNKSTDPDNDAITYDLWLKVISNGKIIKDSMLTTKITNIKYEDYDITGHPDGCKYELKIRAYDGLLYSNWSNILTFEKGSKPHGILYLYNPIINNTNIYTKDPRFTFKGYDKQSIFAVNINGREYSTKTNPERFTISGTNVMFQALDINTDFNIYAYMKNEYGSSEQSSTYSFKRVNCNLNINEGDIITTKIINTIKDTIIDKGKAYNKHFDFDELLADKTYITTNIYNRYREAIRIISDTINNSVLTDDFNKQLISHGVTKDMIIDNTYWQELIEDIKRI